jgi:hypothetical protein
VTVTCVSTAFAFSTNNFTAVAGDTITLTNNTSNFQITTSGSAASNNGTINVPGGTRTLTVTSSSGGQINIVGGQCLGTGVITFTSGGGASSGDSSSPSPIVQQFGKPATGTCADAASSSLNWSSVASGGWGESWAQWTNNGKGGAVCTRTLVYSTTQSKWILG